MIKRLLVICLFLLFTGVMENPTVAHATPSYRTDALEQGNTGGWEESLKTFDNEWSMAQSETVAVDIWIHDAAEPCITAGFWMEFDASQMSIISSDLYSGPWDATMSQTVTNPQGPGTYMVTVGDLSTVLPDSEGDIIIAKVLFQCTSPDDVSITITPIPGFDTVVGDSAEVYDSEMVPHTITLRPTGGVTRDCDDGIACTIDFSGPDDQCSNIPDDTLCDDGLFCNGAETCDPLSGCQPGSKPCDITGECDDETDECISTDEPCTPPCNEDDTTPPGTELPLSFKLIPQTHLQTHWVPLPLFMFIFSEDEETWFDDTTTVHFTGEDIVTPPVRLVLSEKLVYVFSLIRTTGLGSSGIKEIEVTVETTEGAGTGVLHTITLPFF